MRSAELAEPGSARCCEPRPSRSCLPRITLAVAADPAVARPAVAQATIDMNGRVLRAQAAGQTMRGHRADGGPTAGPARPGGQELGALRGTIPAAEPGEWRHQAISAHRSPYFPRAAG